MVRRAGGLVVEAGGVYKKMKTKRRRRRPGTRRGSCSSSRHALSHSTGLLDGARPAAAASAGSPRRPQERCAAAAVMLCTRARAHDRHRRLTSAVTKDLRPQSPRPPVTPTPLLVPLSL